MTPLDEAWGLENCCNEEEVAAVLRLCCHEDEDGYQDIVWALVCRIHQLVGVNRELKETATLLALAGASPALPLNLHSREIGSLRASGA